MTRRAHGKTGGLHSQEAGLWYLESSVPSWMTSPASPTPSWKGIQQQVLERESEADHDSVDWRYLETLLQARRHWFAVEQKGSVGSGSTSTWQTPPPVRKDGREPPDLDSA
ncbi:hypothetical protein H1C71_001430 [Ictidomys tridecemlineatus]|nr:hypothetical protein H1C71_001430 [Ictidomys tridecemlineatus]